MPTFKYVIIPNNPNEPKKMRGKSIPKKVNILREPKKESKENMKDMNVKAHKNTKQTPNCLEKATV